MDMKKNVTFDDIAKFTHFSKTTISRYFNDPETLAPDSRQIIADALVALRYQENKLAKILANGRTEFIGIIIPEFYHHFFYEILSHILATYERKGYKFLVFVGNQELIMERQYIQELMAYQIEGLIVLSHTIPSEELARLGLPVVTIEREDRYVSSVNTNNDLGGVLAAQMLHQSGAEVMIHINSPTKEDVPAYGRILGFVRYCEEHGLEHQVLFRPLDVSYEADLETLRLVVDQLEAAYPHRRKGVFIANDTLANELFNVVFRRYGTFPRDYCLVGFDNSPVSREAVFPISTMGQQVERLAHEAVELLVAQIEAKKAGMPRSTPVHRVIDPVPLPRETT